MVSRRDFLLMCAVASGVPMVSPDARPAAGVDVPKKGGTLRVGFYIEAATMDPHFSGSKIDRQVDHNIYEPLVTLDVKLGIKPGLAESWQQPDPKTLIFRLRRGVKFHDGTDFNVQEAEVIQAQLREAGITMKIKLVDSATLISDGNNKNFEMISYQWSGRPDPDGNTYQFYKTTQGTSLNWSGISNPQIDALLDRSREVSSQAERKKLFSDLTKILHDELPMVFIIHPIEPKAFSPKVQGYEPIPDGMMRFKDVWLQ